MTQPTIVRVSHVPETFPAVETWLDVCCGLSIAWEVLTAAFDHLKTIDTGFDVDAWDARKIILDLRFKLAETRLLVNALHQAGRAE